MDQAALGTAVQVVHQRVGTELYPFHCQAQKAVSTHGEVLFLIHTKAFSGLVALTVV